MSHPEVSAVMEELHVHVKIYAEVCFPKCCHLPTLFPSDLSALRGMQYRICTYKIVVHCLQLKGNICGGKTLFRRRGGTTWPLAGTPNYGWRDMKKSMDNIGPSVVKSFFCHPSSFLENHADLLAPMCFLAPGLALMTNRRQKLTPEREK